MGKLLPSLLITKLLIILLLSACGGKATITTTTIEDGWIRLNIKDIGSIDYPAYFLELQPVEYKTVGDEFNQMVELNSSEFTLQQIGLNELKPSALSVYRRILFTTVYLNTGEEVFKANENCMCSKSELAELQQGIIEQLRQVLEISGNRLIESVSLEIEDSNGMFPLVHTYKKQLDNNPVVIVKNYQFRNYDMIHYLCFSYSVEDEEECKGIYDMILDSLRLY